MKTINKRKTPFAPPCLWWLLWLSLTAGGCIGEYYPEGKEEKAEEPVPVTIRLFTRFGGEGKSTATRGLSETDEGQVNDAYIFFLRASDNTVHSVVKGKDVTNTSNTEKTFTANLEVAGSAGQQFRCIVLANAGSLLGHQSLKLYEGKTYDEIQRTLVSETAYASAPVLAAGDFVMWGEAVEKISADRHPQTLTVHMLRAVARLDIGLGGNPSNWDGKDETGRTIPFRLKKVFIYNPNDRCAFMPLAGAYDAGAQRVTRPSPAGTVCGTPFEYDVQPSGTTSFTASIYLPEANILHPAGGVSVADPQPGDANHTKRCAIVVGGSYKEHTDTYYRIDFRNGTVLADLLRNHRYRASITSVTGDGEATPDEAYRSNRINISATVLPWNDWSQDVIFDGVDHVYVEKKSILLPGNAGLTGAIAVESNVDPDEWQMSFDGANYSFDTVISNADFEAAKPASGTTEGNLLIRTRNQLADGAQPKTATLTVKIHRLSFTIRIEQRPDTPEDWVDGGEFPKDF